MIQEAIEGANGILVTTEYVRDHLVRELIDLPTERFLVLPCGIDLEEFCPGRSAEVARKYELPENYVICPGALKPPSSTKTSRRRSLSVMESCVSKSRPT